MQRRVLAQGRGELIRAVVAALTDQQCRLWSLS